MEQLKIVTDRLIITEFDESMAECVHLNSLDVDNRQFVPDEVFETLEEAQETIAFLMKCYKDGNGPLVYPILLKNGINIGYVQAVPLDSRWEIGYHIAKRHTNHGYATEAVKAFLPIIMKRLHISEINGVCVKENIASRTVMENCGFRLEYEGMGTYHGSQHTICMYIFNS